MIQPRSKHPKYQFVRAHQVSWSARKRIKRAGVILYYDVRDVRHFVLGLDARFQEWTDFGGQLNAGETGYLCAFREMQEETLGVFNEFFTTEDLKSQLSQWVAMIQSEMVILFVPVPIQELEPYQKEFQHRVDQMRTEQKHVENSAIRAFTVEELGEAVRGQPVHGHTMYQTVQMHIRKKWTDFEHWNRMQCTKRYSSDSDFSQCSPRITKNDERGHHESENVPKSTPASKT